MRPRRRASSVPTNETRRTYASKARQYLAWLAATDFRRCPPRHHGRA